MGKWSFIKDVFPAVAEDSAYEEKVRVAREALMKPLYERARGGDMTEVRREAARMYDELREEKDRLEEATSAVNLKIAALERVVLEGMEAAGVESFKGGGFTYTDYWEPTCKVVDKIALLRWIDKKKMREMLTLPYPTLLAFVKEQIIRGPDGLMPDGVEVQARRSLRRVKSGK